MIKRVDPNSFADFPEHDQLRHQLRRMAEGEQQACCLVIPGVTGSGKTALVNRIKHEYSDTVISTTSNMEYGPEAVLQALNESLHPLTPEEIRVKYADDAEWVPDPPFETLIPGLVETLRNRGIRLIMIDNADRALRSRTPGARRGTSSFLRFLLKNTGCNLALLGLPEVIGLHQDRIGSINSVTPVGMIGDSPAYRSWLRMIEAKRRRGEHEGRLDDDSVAVQLLARGQGIVSFIEDLAVDIVALPPAMSGRRRLADMADMPASLLARLDFYDEKSDLAATVAAQWRLLSW